MSGVGRWLPCAERALRLRGSRSADSPLQQKVLYCKTRYASENARCLLQPEHLWALLEDDIDGDALLA